jgi:hypothetical protein
MASTWAAKLALVEAAIEAVLTGGQDVQFDGKRVTEADLSQLQKLEQYYTSKAAREARGGGIRTRYGVPS